MESFDGGQELQRRRSGGVTGYSLLFGKRLSYNFNYQLDIAHHQSGLQYDRVLQTLWTEVASDLDCCQPPVIVQDFKIDINWEIFPSRV